MSKRVALIILAISITGVVPVVLAQSSANYEVTESSMVTTAGDTSSPTYEATLIGGDGGAAETTSSDEYGVVLGAGDPDPVDPELIFGSGFE